MIEYLAISGTAIAFARWYSEFTFETKLQIKPFTCESCMSFWLMLLHSRHLPVEAQIMAAGFTYLITEGILLIFAIIKRYAFR